MITSVFLLGQIADHSRGQVLSEALDAKPASALPDSWGICLAFGSELQELPFTQQSEWASWAVSAGRTLLLLPPFRLVELDVPSSWRVFRQDKVEAGEARGLPKLLSSEVRHGVAGTLQIPTHLGANWKDGVINTGYYKKHPHSGIFAITTLPLWSLTVLDHRKALLEWLTELHMLAGEPTTVEQTDNADTFVPTPDHFAIMLHLCERDYASSASALETLDDSPVLVLPRAAAEQRLAELETVGLVSGGQLTDAGRNVLLGSPYAAYAEAMETKRK